MNTPCSVKLLESALDGNLPEEDEAALHRHLEECEACSTALEQMAGGQGWCREAVTLLLRDKLDMAAPTRDTWSEVDFTVEHLEPADEPNMLGRLGGYDVLEIIGHGGMGVVLKGFDRELKRSVAIKVLAPHLAQNSLARKRFAREAQAAAAVVHPHVLAIHQVQPGGRLPFLVMPLVAGESLADRLKTKGMLELKEILRIGMQAAAGLAAAHEQGLVHRDVKPANILLERGVERAVLTDFGLARAADDVTLTRWGIIAGTPQYMSPEQARGEPLDARSDLFSLGCVLYEMATGVSPFRTDSVMATMRRLIDDSPQSIGSLNPELPAWFIAIVDRLLEKDPARRFSSAKEVSELLEGCLAHVQQPAGVPLPAALATLVARRESPRAVARTPAPTFGWRGPRFVSVVALAAVFAFGLFGILLKQATDPPDIAGQWAGDEWGQVVLIKTSDSEYKGTYSDTIGKRPGEIRLKWSRIERRFNGTWREGDDRFGELSVRLLDYEIRGALTTDAKSKINPATPRLADLTWTKGATNATQDAAAASKYPYEGVTTLVHSVHVEMRYFEMPDGSPQKVTTLDLATLEKKPGVNVLFTPAVVAISGQEVNIQEAHRPSADADIAPMLTGITARVRPTLDGETVHYSLSVRVRLTPYDVDRATFQESVHNGDAQLDRPAIVDIGKGETGRRLLARMVFLRSGTAPSGIALGTLPVMKPGTTVPALVIQAEIRFVELPEDLPFDSDKAEAGELDLAEIRKLPRVRVLDESTLLINNGRDCLFRFGGDIGGFHPGPGIMARLTVLLDGQLAHYTINLSIRLQQTTDGIARMTDHELTNFGEARLDQLRIVDIGKGPDNRRYLAWIVFRRGPTIFSPPVSAPVRSSSSLVPSPYTGVTDVLRTTRANLNDLAFRRWMKEVAVLAAEKQVEAIAKKLEELNPGSDGKVTPGLENGVVTGLSFVTDSVTDISPIQAFVGLRRLDCRGSGRRDESKLSDLSPLKGLPLTMLACPLTRVSDLSSLRGMPLTKLTCDSTHVSDLSPLKGMKLTYLSCSQTQVSDLSPLKGMPLRELYCGGSKVTDLSALGGIPLSYLRCDGTQVSDLSPLQQCTSLKYLNVSHTQVTQAGVAALQKALPNCNVEWDNPASSARIYKALDELTEIECYEMPLIDLIEYLEQRHHVTVKLDEVALKQSNVDIDSPMSSKISNISLKDALQAVLAPFKLTFIVKDGALLITTEAEANKR